MTPPLVGWANFYMIVGSASGALIGLQFVAMSLISDMVVSQGSAEAGHAFATPTIVHFCVAFFIAALGAAPWPTLETAAIVWGLLGVMGIIYSGVVLRRMLQQSGYKPEFEDWLFHAVLPFATYALLASSAWEADAHGTVALFAVASSAILLLFIGIHNAWDAVTYHIFVVRRKRVAKQKDEKPANAPTEPSSSS
jgi:hypothetical protein